jgi:AcrR family transcriptional regulator
MKHSKPDILRAAGECLRRTHFQQVSMEDIAAELDVPRAVLYYHFGSKGNLLFEILRTGSERALEQVSEIVSLPVSPADRVRLAIRALALHNMNDASGSLAGSHHLDSVLLTADQRRELIVRRDAIDDRMRRLLEEAIVGGAARPVNTVVVANAILTAIGRLQTWFKPDGDLGLEDVIEIYCDLFLTGLSPESPPGPHDSSARPRRNSSRSGGTK